MAESSKMEWTNLSAAHLRRKRPGHLSDSLNALQRNAFPDCSRIALLTPLTIKGAYRIRDALTGRVGNFRARRSRH
jgi:hypothetical protein